MKFKIMHEMKGRMRVHMLQQQMTFREADILQEYLEEQGFVTAVKIYERTCDVVICYQQDRQQVIRILQQFTYEKAAVAESGWQNPGRENNRQCWDKLVWSVVCRIGKRLFLPMSVREWLVLFRATGYVWKGFKTLQRRKIEVPVLDAIAIAVSVLRRDFKTASSVMFLLKIGEILEEWTHKKSVNDLARSMSLKVKKVWLLSGEQEILTDIRDIRPQDTVVIHMGNVLPFDGIVTGGFGMVNQASLTGEALAVPKKPGGYVYAGTVLEEGELQVKVQETAGTNKYDKIIAMIEETEKLKSSLEGQAEHLADKLVPYTLLGTALVYLLTRNTTRALSVLMVDFSCALKLAMPISVLAALREAGAYKITVKGGKFLERMAEADTIVFDKTGTLTNASPVVVQVVPFVEEEPDELLRLAACLEEHFPHSMAKAVVEAARQRGLTHEEKHSKVEYIVAHGISSLVDGKKVLIGSYHFIFEDAGCRVAEDKREVFEGLPEEYSHLYLAVEGQVVAAISIEDPLRREAAETIAGLRKVGFREIVMMTGDSEKTACAIAQKVGVDAWYAEVLPEEKAQFVESRKARGSKVIMVGDGVNDSPALSAADVGIAINDGAQIAREIADIIIEAGSLQELITLKKISTELVKKIRKNYRNIVEINSILILLGVCGILPPAASALIHNTSTLVISLHSMKNLLE